MRRLVGSRAGAVLLCSVVLTSLAVPMASPASAAACHALVAKPLGESSNASVVVTIPTALIGQDLRASNFTLRQGATPVQLRSAQRLGAARVDLALVLDTAASAPDPAYTRARRLGASVLRALPPGVRVAVVSGGRNPRVLSALGAPRERALVAVRQAGRSGGHAGIDGVALAADLLATSSARSRHVVLISTGSDNESQRDAAQVVSTLDERGTTLHAVSVRGPVEPSWGGQCPSTVGGGQEAAAGSLLARRVAETYELVPTQADPSVPMTVRARSGPVDASAQLAFAAPDTAVRGTRIERPEPAGSERGATVWIVAGLLLLAMALALGVRRFAPVLPRRASRSRSSWLTDTHGIEMSEPPSRRLPPVPPQNKPD